MNLLEGLISLIAPHDCIVCGVEGDLLCGGCLESELTEVVSRCYRCHRASPNHAVCTTCRKTVGMRHVWVATYYNETPKELIHVFKFKRAIAAARTIAEKIDRILPVLSVDTLVCHIPTANSRVRLRGYDQGKEIAKNVARLRGYSHKNFLVRVGTSRQVGADRKSRFKQLENAFRLRNGSEVKGLNILLVDDVTTTGATIETAAKLLKRAGAKNVDAAVFSQPG